MIKSTMNSFIKYAALMATLLAVTIGLSHLAHGAPPGAFPALNNHPGTALDQNMSRDVVRDAKRGINTTKGEMPLSDDMGEWQTVPVPQGDFWKSQPPIYNDQGWED